VAKQLTSEKKEAKTANGANLGFEQKLWAAADKLRNNMDAAEYKHVVLGLIFLKYISDAFGEVYMELKKDPDRLADPEDVDEYRARNAFWVSAKARWDCLQKNAKQPTICVTVDDAMDAVERENSSLKGSAAKRPFLCDT
jgi:type I restriction enzyme M protein